jgi:integrase
MTAATWPVVTCTACGATGPGRPKVGLCKRCYARAQHPVQACGGCGQTRRHLAAGLCARCYRLSLTRLTTCRACGELRPVYLGDRCERCKRRAAAKAGACAECGKQVARLWAGRCRACHARRYQTTGACRDCGDLTKLTSGLCSPCRLFRWKHPIVGLCPYCGRQQPIGATGGCRSCQAALRADRALARARRKRRVYASTGGCQDCGDLARLITGLCSPCRQFRSSHPLGTCPYCGRQQPIGATGGCRSCQAALRAVRGHTPARPQRPARPELTAASWQLLEAITRYGSARGWAPSTQQCARRALVAVLTSGGDLGQPPWDAGHLRRFLTGRRLVALRVVEFLTDEGLACTNPHAVLDQWLACRLAALPAPFAAEVQTWTEALHGRGPRAGRPRHPRTIEAYLRVLETPLAAWAATYGSLRQVTTEDLTAQLDTFTGATRRLAMAAMRSLFTTLKARRVLFTNPARPLTGRALPPPPVLPLGDTQRARLLCHLNEPAQRLIVLLAGVHALRPSQICALTLDDAGPAASTLLTSGRARPLDQLTTSHLRAWLDARHARWPTTANPHLLINRSTAGGLKPVDRSYVQATMRRAGITAAELRADRLLDEAHASGGDPLRLTHLFGISDPTAIRYCAEIDQLSYDAHQALEGATGSAGRTESTSTSN